MVHSTKSLGDVVSDGKSNKDLIDYKISKGKAAMVSILALCTEITFGIHYICTGVLLYKCVFIPSLLFNSEVWTRLTKTDMNRLQVLQLKALKRVTHMPNSTSNCFIFLELGVLPMKHEISKRKLMFLFHIHTLNDDDPVKEIHKQQQLLPYERNWSNEVKELIDEYKIAVDDIQNISKYVWKNRVTSAICEKAHRELQSECTSMTKTKLLKYTTFGIQNYLSKLPAYLATLLLRIRSKTLSCKANHPSSFPQDQKCRLCRQADETQEHIINCYAVHQDDEWLPLHEYMRPDPCVDEVKLEEVYRRYTLFLDLVNEV